MRSLIPALLVLFFSASVFASFDENKGLVAYFSFNHCDARDDSGQGSYGQLLGNVRCWCGVEDDGLLLDGADARVVFSGTINHYFTTSDFTLSFYFKPESRQVFPQSLVSKRAACDEDNVLDIAYNATLAELTTDFKESEYKLYHELSPEVQGTGWQHYALVREGVYARTYLNGKLVRESRRCSGIDLSNEAPFSIGDSPCLETGRMRRFQGVIDELRLYERALSEEDILQLYLLYPVENAQMDCLS